MSTSAIVAAAGRGERLGGHLPKQFISIAGKPMLYYAIYAFEHCDDVDHLVVVVPAGYEADADEGVVRRFEFGKVIRIVAGGRQRQDSVRAGLSALPSGTKLVAIHDGARPFVSIRIIRAVLQAAQQYGAAIPAVALKDTIKQTSAEVIVATLNRNTIVASQTPQAFLYQVIEDAYQKAFLEGMIATDDATLVEKIGYEVCVVEGDPRNIKVTTPDDLAYAEWLVAEGKWSCE